MCEQVVLHDMLQEAVTPALIRRLNPGEGSALMVSRTIKQNVSNSDAPVLYRGGTLASGHSARMQREPMSRPATRQRGVLSSLLWDPAQLVVASQLLYGRGDQGYICASMLLCRKCINEDRDLMDQRRPAPPS